MITLKTLPKATAQEVFDQVKNHLLAQGCRSEDENTGLCMYREGTLKCAAGCLIEDAEYSESMEKKDWVVLVDAGIVPENHFELITALQECHDWVDPDKWKGALWEIAEDFGLKYDN